MNTVRVLRGSGGERIPLALRTGTSSHARGGNNATAMNGNNAVEDVGGGGLPPGIIFAPGSNNQRPNEQLNGRYTVRNKRPQSARIQRGSGNSSSSLLLGPNPEPQKVVNVVQLSPDGPYQPYTYDPRDVMNLSTTGTISGSNRRQPSGRSTSALRGIGVPHAAGPVPFFNRGGGVNSDGSINHMGGINHGHNRRSSSPRVMPVQMSFGALCKAVERLADQISNDKT